LHFETVLFLGHEGALEIKQHEAYTPWRELGLRTGTGGHNLSIIAGQV